MREEPLKPELSAKSITLISAQEDKLHPMGCNMCQSSEETGSRISFYRSILGELEQNQCWFGESHPL